MDDMSDQTGTPITKKMAIVFAAVLSVGCLRAEAGDWDIPTDKEDFHVFLLGSV